MQALWLAKVEDDTIFIITLGVVLVVVQILVQQQQELQTKVQEAEAVVQLKQLAIMVGLE